MRKLIVKNFSVIKEAELEFGKITILIGPQSSGKSLLCKLAYFFGPVVTEIISEFLVRQRPWSYLEEFVSIQFHNRFPEVAWGDSAFSVKYQQGRYDVSAASEPAGVGRGILIAFSDEVKSFYKEKLSSPWGGKHEPERDGGELRTSFRTWNYLLDLYEMQEHRTVETSTFIPANRSFFANLNNVFELFRNENVDIIVREFAAKLDWSPKSESVKPLTPVKVEILKAMETIQGGKVLIDDGKPAFEGSHGIIVPLGLTSSGTQDLVPLFMLLSLLVKDTYATDDGTVRVLRDRLLVVEEPEGHVFPDTQYQLVRLFAWLANEPSLDFSWVLTTHSPYILTAFNTLIEAWRVGNKEGKREQVASLVPEKYWVNENDFKAYAIHDGVLVSIFEPEQEGKEGSGLIDGNYLDSVSDQLGGEFEQLLDIEYAK